MHADELTDYLHHQIPLSRAMGLHVVAADAGRVRLGFPLAPNDNHKGTAFGGSLSTAATLAAWTLLFLRLREEGMRATVVIQWHQIDYDRPAQADFIADAAAPAPDVWQRFVHTLRRRGRARIELEARVDCGSSRAALFLGRFVALGD